MNEDFSAFPFDGFVPENGVGVHDPAVLDFNGRYLCVCTSGNGFGDLRESTDLIHWKIWGPLMNEPPKWLEEAIPMHRSIWAPELVRFGSGLRLYYCASAAFGHNNSWIGVAENPTFDPDHPTAGWHDLGPVIESKQGRDNFNAIDPSILQSPDGRWWMYFGSYWSGLYVAELDPITGKLKQPDGSGKVLIAKNPSDPANGIEAPSAIYRDGHYYLFVSYGLAATGVRSTYHTVVGRGDSPTGPFTDAGGKAMTEGGHESFLDSSSPMFGPGGGTATRDSHGRWRFAHHYYDGRAWWHGHIWGRPTLQVREIEWSPDGWPLPGLPVTPETEKLANSRLSSPVGSWRQQADFGQVNDLSINRDGTCKVGDRLHGEWSQTGNQLKFEWSGDEGWIDQVTLSYGGRYFVGLNQNRLLIRGFKEPRK